MNRALWQKTIGEAMAPLIGCTVLLFGFSWVFVWLSSMLNFAGLATMLGSLFTFLERLAGVPFAELMTPAGKISLLYIHAVTLFTCVSWSLSRGSDAISGEIGRGTMEMLLAQPVRRGALVLVQAAVATGGSVVLAAAVWLGTGIGLWTVDIPDRPALSLFIPASLNLFSLMVCLAGMTTFISAWHRERWQTIGLAFGIFIFEVILDIVSRGWPGGWWLCYLTFQGAFEPHTMVIRPETAWWISLKYNGVLLSLGITFYIAAAAVFCRRDVPAPL